MFFSSIKGVNRLRSEGMSNIYLKVTIEKKLCSQKFDFLNLKNVWLLQFTQISFNSKIKLGIVFLLQLKN